MAEEVKVSYSIVGRYMNGKEVTGYQIQSTKGESKRVTREQLCLLVGRGDITNCTGQVYKKKVILKGKGININDLPIVDEKNSKVKNTDKIGAIKKGTSNTDAVNQLMIVRKLVSGGKPVGYVLRNAGGAERKVKRDEVVTLAKDGKIGNARVQMYNGKVLLRGKNLNLNTLPEEEMEAPKKSPAKKAETAKTPAKKETKAPAKKEETAKKSTSKKEEPAKKETAKKTTAKREEPKSANAKAAELLGVKKKETAKKAPAKKAPAKKAPAKKAETAKTEQTSVLDMFDELNPEEIEEKATKKAPAKKAASKAPAKKTAKKK